MNAEKTQKEGASRAIQTKLGSRGRMYMEDNRPGAVGQAKFINAIQTKLTPRNVIQRANEKEDEDKSKIDVFPLSEDMQLSVKEGSRGETIVIFEEKEGQIEKQLKHYMVVRNDNYYQFPVKYFHRPAGPIKQEKGGPERLDEKKDDQPQIDLWRPDAGKWDKKRGGQPEGFGGNQDWKYVLEDRLIDENGKMSLLKSCKNTLEREYAEEAQRDEDMEFKIERKKKFATQWGNPQNPTRIFGTLSIASTQKEIHGGVFYKDVRPPLVESYGEAEMAGTIVIDCNELIGNPTLEGDKLEEKIGTLIKNARNDFWGFKPSTSTSSSSSSSTPSSSSSSPSADPFAQEGGILARLVEMVAEDIMIRRALEMSASSSSSSSTPSVPLPPSSTPSFSSSTPTSSSSSSSPSSGMEEMSEDSESVLEEESAEEDSEEESQTDDASEEDVDKEEETDAVEEDGAEEESQTDDVSEERPEHSQSRGWFSTILGDTWRWIKRLFSN